MNISEEEKAHHLQRTQDLYEAMDDLSNYAEKQHMTKPQDKPQETKTQAIIRLHFERAAALLAVLNERGEMDTCQITDFLGMGENKSQVKELLRKMKNRGEVEAVGYACYGRVKRVSVWRALSEHVIASSKRNIYTGPKVEAAPLIPAGNIVESALLNRHPLALAWARPLELREAA